MFDIGFGEMLLLAAIALIAIGPKQLPEVARTIGRLLNEFKRATGEFTKTIADASGDANTTLGDVRNSLSKVVEPTLKQLSEVVDPLKSMHNSINTSVQNTINESLQKGLNPTANQDYPHAVADISANDPNQLAFQDGHDANGNWVGHQSSTTAVAVDDADQMTFDLNAPPPDKKES